ncbi:hypothetical protein Q757_01555 [Oenococcus alcoholitolerans]|uniref:Aminotransferase class V domain-containing protein n=1 Tax=Oenococcus alcoholitolerans TaxID=931074 RepID=A0ABR4XT94_9LACO|nr:hypothetical protein Q757_01555 [Oenococcus alcoholitolerans]
MKRQINGKQLVYLDNAASSQKPRQVIDAISNFTKTIMPTSTDQSVL